MAQSKTDPETGLRWDSNAFYIYDFLRAWGDSMTMNDIHIRLPRPIPPKTMKRTVERLVERGLFEMLPPNVLTGCPARYRTKGTAQ